MKLVQTNEIVLHLSEETLLGSVPGKVVDLLRIDKVLLALIMESKSLKCCFYSLDSEVHVPFMQFSVADRWTCLGVIVPHTLSIHPRESHHRTPQDLFT